MAKQKSLEQLRAEKEQVETQLAQEQHELERLESGYDLEPLDKYKNIIYYKFRKIYKRSEPMNKYELDTPSVLIDLDRVRDNLAHMQAYADRSGVSLRPHTKTHKMPELAKLQLQYGACGITVAKVAEAEVMAAYGMGDIFIANEIVGEEKFRRLQALSEHVSVSFGLDSQEQADFIEASYAKANKKAEVLIEIEVGEDRSGVVELQTMKDLLHHLKHCPHIHLKGVFSHDGHSYGACSREEGAAIHLAAQKKTLEFADAAREMGFSLQTISIGSTPSLLAQYPILPGITELRPGTYIFMDAAQANRYGDDSRNAATVLATVISKPTPERVILDVGAKGLTMQTRTKGLCTTKGLGKLVGWEDVYLERVFDEHAIILNRAFHDAVQVGDKVEIIPNHICPVINLYDTAWLVSGEEVLREVAIAGRGKLR